jgi:hypothetical protein
MLTVTRKVARMAHTNWLTAPFLLNILILVPICYSMFLGAGVANVFEGRVPESAGLRLMVGSLWLAILVASVAGLVWPAFFAPVILIQVFYKLTWLIVFILPLWRAGLPYPMGISGVFAFIVVTYPVAFWLAARQA